MQQKILCSRTQQLLRGLLHLSELATSLNFVFAAVPTEVTAVMQTTTIKASITAYYCGWTVFRNQEPLYACGEL